ncbi:MAG: IS3 family transposase [Solirubrobacterales bacterium]|nr:IS3 family transposase [Solirubrobacterales bacterium]
MWIADFTYLRSWEGAGFFSFVIDVFSRRASAGSLPRTSHRPRPRCAEDGARHTRSRPDIQLVHHSDRGSQAGLKGPSQHRDWWCEGNSVGDGEQPGLLLSRVWQTRTQLELAVVEWVGWYNHDRLHSAIGHIPPVEYENGHAVTVLFNFLSHRGRNQLTGLRETGTAHSTPCFANCTGRLGCPPAHRRWASAAAAD